MLRSRTAFLSTLASVAWLSVVCVQAAETDKPSAPFVAGFDRFGRHGDIPPQLAGTLLLSELSCTACHMQAEERLAPKRGPRLNGIADRVDMTWVKHFLADPDSAKPGTTMPDVFAGFAADDKRHAIECLAAYLSTQHQTFPEIKATGGNPVPNEFWNKGDVARGRQLYHQVGCVACHEPNADYEVAEIPPSPIDTLLEQLDADELQELGLAAAARRVVSIPHGDLPAKYTPQSLTFFLLNPETVRPGGRMPSLKLQAVEAADIAAYLLQKQEPSDSPTKVAVNSALIDEGRRLFNELRCINCHDTHERGEHNPASPLAELDATSATTCLSSPHKGLPHYALDPQQSAAVQAALSSPQVDPDDTLQLTLLKFNCYACHERDDHGGVGRFRKPYFETVGHIDLGDEGRLPPSLTGVGRKLRPEWMKKVLDGNGDVRPHLQIRMPKFPAPAVASLPNELAKADGASRQSESEVFGSPGNVAEAGRQLMDIGCVQCHQFRGETLPGTVGTDLAGIAARVNPQWFHDFLMDPGSLKNRTRMPTFFPGGVSQNKDVLNGDPEQQIAAMWTYLKQLDKLPLPEKIVAARSESFELVPQDRPILLRTFMDEAGTHAIAVGFPEKVHFAFDAEHVRLAYAWRHGFLDALGTWFVRFAPPAHPLGDAAARMPAGSPFAILPGEAAPWPTEESETSGYRFGGYKLDDGGTPTFLSRFGNFDVQDRIIPDVNQGLRRTVTITPRDSAGANSRIYFRAQVGKTLKPVEPAGYTNEQGLTVSLPKERAAEGIVRKTADLSEWIIPLDIDEKTTIEVHYSW